MDYRKVGLLFVGAVLFVGLTAGAGLKLFGADFDVNGNDIVDGATTVWDSSNNYIPSGQLDLNGLAGNQLTVSGSSIGVSEGSGSGLNADTVDGTEASNLGDGYLPDTPATSDVDMSSNIFRNTARIELGTISSTDTPDDYLEAGGDLKVYPDINATAGISIADEQTVQFNNLDAEISSSDATYTAASAPLALSISGNSKGVIEIISNGNACYLDPSDGSWNCDGSKNWVHDLNSSFAAYYSSQESPQVRAVFEGQEYINGSEERIKLPSHFSMTVSDTEPMLRVQATPHQLGDVAVTERTDDYIVVKTEKPMTVDYRVTGIREGYEDKQVVRKKEQAQ